MGWFLLLVQVGNGENVLLGCHAGFPLEHPAEIMRIVIAEKICNLCNGV